MKKWGSDLSRVTLSEAVLEHRKMSFPRPGPAWLYLLRHPVAFLDRIKKEPKAIATARTPVKPKRWCVEGGGCPDRPVEPGPGSYPLGEARSVVVTPTLPVLASRYLQLKK